MLFVTPHTGPSGEGPDSDSIDERSQDPVSGADEVWLEHVELGSAGERSRGKVPSHPVDRETALAFAALICAIAVGAAILQAGWELGRAGEKRLPAARPATVEPAPPPPTSVPAATPPAPFAPPPAPVPTVARLILTAARGDCWLSVRAGSPTGERLFEGTLTRGKSIRVERARVWIRLGAPENLEVLLNGAAVEGFPGQTADVLVTARGVRVVSRG